MSQGIKTVGGRNLPPQWDRFDRLQRTAQVLLGGPVSPKGVFRFKTLEDFNAWTAEIQLRRGRPAK